MLAGQIQPCLLRGIVVLSATSLSLASESILPGSSFI